MLQILAAILDCADHNIGVGAAVFRQNIRHDIARHQRGDTKLQLPGYGIVLRIKRAARTGNRGQNICRVAQELVAANGNVQPARVAFKQLDAKIALQILYCGGDG